MPTIPKWKEIPNYPVICAVTLLCTGVTLAWWSGVRISPLFETVQIRRGELWRLITSILPHTDIIHLAFNVYWLWVLGTTMERVWGHLRTGALILLFAIGSSSLDFAFDRGGVGLSGVGYGLFGLLYVLSKYDERFKGAVESKTVSIFVAWFFFCIIATMTHMFAVANVAHAAGTALGMLLGFAVVLPNRRRLFVPVICVLILFGLCGATFARPFINLSRQGGYEEGQLGYAALNADKNKEALSWLRDAVRYQPKIAVFWFDLGIAYQRVEDEQHAAEAYQRAYELEPGNPDYASAAGK